MTVTLILLLVVTTAVLCRLERRRGTRILSVLTVLLTLVIGYGAVPALMLRNLQAGFPDTGPQLWQPRAAIVVLGGGIQHIADARALQVTPLANGRILKALELYRQCRQAGKACVLVVSGGDPDNLGTSEAKVYAAVLEELGVDSADLVTEGNSLNTWQNARFCAAWLRAHPQDQVVLVTSGMHVRRSLLYFSHFGVPAQGVRADYVGALVSAVPQAYNFLVTDLALHEYAGVARYHLYELLGLNIEAHVPERFSSLAGIAPRQ
jgi:uncharacterized SAM-binding protein YcdF (DUF218 family)